MVSASSVGSLSAMAHQVADRLDEGCQPLTESFVGAYDGKCAWVPISERYMVNARKASFQSGKATYRSRRLAELLNFIANFVVVARSLLSPDIIVGCCIASLSTSLFWAFGQGLQVQMSWNFMSVAVVFPLTTGIGFAFNRRESALKELATLLGNLRSIWDCLHNWTIKVDGAHVPMDSNFDEASRCAYRERNKPVTMRSAALVMLGAPLYCHTMRRSSWHVGCEYHLAGQLIHELLTALVAYFHVPRGHRARHMVSCCMVSRLGTPLAGGHAC